MMSNSLSSMSENKFSAVIRMKFSDSSKCI